MPKLKDLTNYRFGSLVVLHRDTKSKYVKWVCKCDCGNTKSVRSCHLVNGLIRSCGCLPKESTIQRNKLEKSTHGKSNTRLYNIWHSMKQRCYYKDSSDYQRYGGRGIKICDEWLNDFQSFYSWSLENGYSKTLTIDRIDNDLGYCPSNCRWVTTMVQNYNRKQSIIVTVNGETHTLKEWSELLNVDYQNLYYYAKRSKVTNIENEIRQIMEVENNG